MVQDLGQILSEYFGAMAFVEKESELWSEVSSVSGDEGLRLYDLEKQGNRKLKVTLANSESVREGVSIDGCARVCKRLQLIFAAEGAQYGLIEEPELDVSSPGVNRELRTREHLVEALGERVCLKFSGADGKKQSVIGELNEFTNDRIELSPEDGGDALEVSFSDLVEARIDFKF